MLYAIGASEDQWLGIDLLCTNAVEISWKLGFEQLTKIGASHDGRINVVIPRSGVSI